MFADAETHIGAVIADRQRGARICRNPAECWPAIKILDVKCFRLGACLPAVSLRRQSHVHGMAQASERSPWSLASREE